MEILRREMAAAQIELQLEQLRTEVASTRITTALLKRRRLDDHQQSGHQSQPSLVTLLEDPERFWPINQHIFSSLDIKDIIALSRTCTALTHVYERLVPLLWNIDARLRTFFDDPLTFRNHLCTADGLVAGTFALQFFARQDWDDGLLEIYVHSSLALDVLSRHLKQTEGYVIADWRSAVEMDVNGINVPTVDGGRMPWGSVLDLRRAGNRGQQQRHDKVHVKLYSTRENINLIDLILNAPTTASLNFITADTAYSLFPRLTFVEDRMHILDDVTLSLAEHLGYLRRYGWHPSEKLIEAELDSILEQSALTSSRRQDQRPPRHDADDILRRIGDSETWTIDLKQQSRTPNNSSPQGDRYQSSTFRLKRTAPQLQHQFRLLVPYCVPLFSPALRHIHACASEELRAFILDRLALNVSAQLARLPPNARPMASLQITAAPPGSTGGGDLHSVNRRAFVTPRSMIRPRLSDREAEWEYLDHMLPRIYDAYRVYKETFVEDGRKG